MIEIDLITGFLGAGKTTFIREYAKYYMDRGIKVCILENDFGAVNVDMLLLNDLYEKGCGMEMLAGACDKDCHSRRLKTKLIAMRMFGYQRVIVEPSGIYDTEEFFDVLREEPLDEWYHIDNVITLVDAGLSADQTQEAEYLLATQLCSAGEVVFGKTDITEIESQRNTVNYINELLKRHHCERQFTPEKLVGVSYRDRFCELSHCGYRTETPGKLWFDTRETFDSVYFMNLTMDRDTLEDKLQTVIQDTSCGSISRIKGFVREADSEAFLQVNVTAKEFSVTQSGIGQAVLIIIGEHLNREVLSAYIGKEADKL